MQSLVNAMLSNAVAATLLALAPLALSRTGRSPALIHGLWLVVLLKLVTPPLIEIPLVVTTAAPLAALSERLEPSPRSVPAAPSNRHEPAARSESLFGDDGIAEWENIDQNQEPVSPAGSVEPDDSPRKSSSKTPLVEPEQSPARESLALTMRPAAAQRNLPSWEFVALALNLVGCVVCWSLAAVRINRFRSLLRDLRPASEDLQARVRVVAHQLAIKRAPTTWLVPGRIPPMLWTLGGRARLLLPAELWPGLSESQQTALITHELAHLRRKDHLVRWLDLIVTGLYWWHPVVWWARRGLRETEEQCCDAWAIWAEPRESRSYAAALLAALEFVSGAPTAGVAAAAAVVNGRGHVSFLKRRMRMIVRARTPKALSWSGRLAVLSVAALVLPLAPTWAQKADSPKPTSQPAAAPTDLKAGGGYIEFDKNNDGRLVRLEIQDPGLDGKSRQQPKGEADDDDRGDKDATENLERLLKDLGEKLSKDLGPVGSEFLKTLDKAVKDASDALDKNGITSEDVHRALEKARDDLHDAFKDGSPLNRQARDAVDKAREDLHEAVDKAREEIREAVRERADQARESVRESLRPQVGAEDEPPAAAAGSSGGSTEVEQARREIRQMEQQLRQAMRRLQEIERREQRQRGQRRGPGGPPAPPIAPAPPGAPQPGAGAPKPPESPAPPEAPTTPVAPRFLRRPGLGGPGGFGSPGGPPALNPRVERRLRDLEDKMDRLLKELESLKGDKDKDKGKKDSDLKESSQRNRPASPPRRSRGRALTS